MYVVMPKNVTDILPNVKDGYEVFLFHNYVCVEHYPFHRSALIGMTLADVLDLLGLTLPDNCSYVFYRFRDHNATVKEYGANTCIINTKHILSHYAQDASSGD